MFNLVATSPVAGFGKGERITDPDLVQAILADDRAQYVVKVAPLPPEPAPKVKAIAKES